MSNLDLELVRHALGVARKHGFAEVELGVGEDSFSAKLDPAPKTRSNGSASAPAPEAPDSHIVAATLVGYYREAKTPLKVGTTIKKGDVVAIISALGIANDVESKYSGEIIEVLVEPNQPVQYGQALAKVKS